jgi:hypothetical protein
MVTDNLHFCTSVNSFLVMKIWQSSLCSLILSHTSYSEYNWPEFLMTHPTLISIPTHGPEDYGLRTAVADLGGPATTDLNLTHNEWIYRLPTFTIFLSNFILIFWFPTFAVLWMLNSFFWVWTLYSDVSEHSLPVSQFVRTRKNSSCSHVLWR